MAQVMNRKGVDIVGWLQFFWSARRILGVLYCVCPSHRVLIFSLSHDKANTKSRRANDGITRIAATWHTARPCCV